MWLAALSSAMLALYGPLFDHFVSQTIQRDCDCTLPPNIATKYANILSHMPPNILSHMTLANQSEATLENYSGSVEAPGIEEYTGWPGTRAAGG